MGIRLTPVLLAKELGVRPQAIYGLIRQKRIHAFGNKPQMVDVDEVKMVLKTVRHREPKEVKSGRKAQLRRGTIVSYDRRRGGQGGREVASVVGTYKSDDSGGYDYVYMHTGRREITPWEAGTLGERLAKKQTTIEDPEAVFGMLIWQLAQQGKTDEANALDEFLRLTLDMEPVDFTKVVARYQTLATE